MTITLYLSGEIHTDRRDQIIAGTKDMDVRFTALLRITRPAISGCYSWQNRISSADHKG